MIDNQQIKNKYLEDTNILNYNEIIIQSLIKERNWNNLTEKDRINKIYLYVRDEILFGYNENDNIKASQVLREGYGQCNTKANLLMALLRAVSIECRFHGFTIDKELQKGAITGIWFKLAPKEIIHSWVEVKYNNKWCALEGVILDKKYLQKLQTRFIECSSFFCGYGAYTENLQTPKIEWTGGNTYIQKLGINQDFGIFDNPDNFYEKHQQKLNFFKKLIFKLIVRNLMNKNIKNIRNNN